MNAASVSCSTGPASNSCHRIFRAAEARKCGNGLSLPNIQPIVALLQIYLSVTVKHSETLAINRIMTPLKLDTRSKLTLGFLFAVGCSSHVQIANDAIGGQSAQYTGGSSAIGGATGGGPGVGSGGMQVVGGYQGVGGMEVVGGYQGIGGMEVVGGYQAIGGMEEVGGWAATGGAATGGTPATGGAYTGGAWAATGGVYHAYPNPGCTFGADQTCTGDVTVSTLMGHCEADGWCTCNDPYIPNPHAGTCNTYDQTVCYSPTQNIDNAYVNRAFGCHCNSTTPFCGIDSSGLRVYLVCTGGIWQSGDTSNCKS